MWSLAMKVRARNKPISSVPDRAKCQETGISALGWLRGLERREGRLPLSSGPRASSPALAGRGAAAGVYHTPEGSPPGGLSGPGAWVLHMPAVGLVVDDRGRMKQLVLGYPWEAASRCSSLIEATSFHSLPVDPGPWMWEAKPDC